MKTDKHPKHYTLVFTLLIAMPIGYLVYANLIRETQAPILPSNNQVITAPSSSSASFASAVEAAEKAATANPGYQSYLNLGLAYFQAGMYEKSIEATQKAIDSDGKQAVAYNNIAAAYGVLENWDMEIAACEKALQLKPDFQLAKNNLEWAKSQKAKAEKK